MEYMEQVASYTSLHCIGNIENEIKIENSENNFFSTKTSVLRINLSDVRIFFLSYAYIYLLLKSITTTKASETTNILFIQYNTILIIKVVN